MVKDCWWLASRLRPTGANAFASVMAWVMAARGSFA
jgi:hypothetical protein